MLVECWLLLFELEEYSQRNGVNPGLRDEVFWDDAGAAGPLYVRRLKPSAFLADERLPPSRIPSASALGQSS